MFRQHHSHTSGKIKPVVAALGLAALLALAFLRGPGMTSARAQSSTFPLNSVVATTTGLNLRSQPSVAGANVATLPVNARALVLGGPFNDLWYWLDYNNVKGYASARYLVLVDDKYTPAPSETATATGATPTAAPGTASPSATEVPASPGTQASATPQQTGSPQPSPTAPPGPTGKYEGLWLGEMSKAGSVRSGPGLDKRAIKSWWVGRRVLLYETAVDSKGSSWVRVSEPPEAPMWVSASLVRKVAPVRFEGARFTGRWINVNLAQQIVTAYEDGRPVMVTLTSTGKGKHETTVGTWKIYWRLPKQTMEGGNKASGDYYKLKDVPYPQYFHISGEGLHGTYWHDNFGRPMSHGCVNLSTPIAGWLYGWASLGTVVYVHY